MASYCCNQEIWAVWSFFSSEYLNYQITSHFLMGVPLFFLLELSHLQYSFQWRKQGVYGIAGLCIGFCIRKRNLGGVDWIFTCSHKPNSIRCKYSDQCFILSLIILSLNNVDIFPKSWMLCMLTPLSGGRTEH